MSFYGWYVLHFLHVIAGDCLLCTLVVLVFVWAAVMAGKDVR